VDVTHPSADLVGEPWQASEAQTHEGHPRGVPFHSLEFTTTSR